MMNHWEYFVVVLPIVGYSVARAIIMRSFITLCWKVTADLSYGRARHGMTWQSYGVKQEIIIFIDPSRGEKRWGVIHQHNTTWYDRQDAMCEMASICMQYGVRLSLGYIAYRSHEARLHRYCDLLAKSRCVLWFLVAFVAVYAASLLLFD